MDTFTVRTSTVLLDSVATSTTDNLLVGRYVDSRLGAVQARASTQPSLTAAFTPTSTVVFDSLVLTLRSDAYRYGDTTRTQHLLVQRLRDDFVDKTYYTFDALNFDQTPLGQIGKPAVQVYTFRARPRLRAFRLRLDDALGQELFGLGQGGQLNTQNDLVARFKELAFSPTLATTRLCCASRPAPTGPPCGLSVFQR